MPTTVTPESATQGDTVTLLIEDPGVVFVEDVSFTLFNPDDGITINWQRPISGQTWAVNITIALTASPGPRGVGVWNPAGPPAIGDFTVLLAEPAIVAITPNGGAQGDTFRVQVTGQYTTFTPNTSVLTFSNPGITARDTMGVTGTVLTAIVTIAPFTRPGPCDVTVTTGFPTGPQVAVGVGLFTAVAATQKAVILREGVNTYLRQNHITNPVIVDICEVFIETVNEGLRQQQVYHTATGVTVSVGVEK